MGFPLSAAVGRAQDRAPDGERRAPGADSAARVAERPEVTTRAGRGYPQTTGSAAEDVQTHSPLATTGAGGIVLDTPPFHRDLQFARTCRLRHSHADRHRTSAGD